MHIIACLFIQNESSNRYTMVHVQMNSLQVKVVHTYSYETATLAFFCLIYYSVSISDEL